MKKHYYAKVDWTATSDNPGYGFVNSKQAIAFKSYQELQDFLRDREQFDYSAQRISRRQAEKMAESIPESRDKGVMLGAVDTYTDFLVLRESKY